MITIGVDLGIHKIAWSVWENDVLLETEAITQEGPTRHHELSVLRYHAHNMLVENPDQIFIEDVLIGNNRKYSIQLAETKGAVLAGLGKWGNDSVAVVPVNVSTWKKELFGNGKATKDMIKDYIYDQDSAYAVLCGNDQDRFDAAAIGYYGYVIARRSEALADSGFSHREVGS